MLATWGRELARQDLRHDEQIFRLTESDDWPHRNWIRAELQHSPRRTLLLRERTERGDSALDEVEQRAFEVSPACWEEVQDLVTEAGIWSRAELLTDAEEISRIGSHNDPARFEARRGREYRDFELFQSFDGPTLAIDRLVDFMARKPIPTCP